jgi:hypothetical protein
MAFVIEVTSPCNTLITEPSSESLRLPPCYLQEIYLDFPAGCAGLVGVYFSYQSTQIIPANRGNYYKGNGILIPIKSNIPIQEEDYTLTMFAYNLDDTYPHTVRAFINVTIMAEKLTDELLDILSTLDTTILEGRG